MFGIGEILVLISIGVIFLSWRKLPQIGSTLGKSVTNFKRALSGEEKRPIRDVEELRKPEQQPDEEKE